MSDREGSRGMLVATPDTVRIIPCRLDHPESIFIDERGVIYAGGEAGQIYRLEQETRTTLVASTGGNILGLVLDAAANVYACDYHHKAVFRVTPDGNVTAYSRGTKARPMTFPNHLLFDTNDDLFVSDSGQYWSASGCVFAVRPDGRTEVFHEGPFHFANGIALDPSGEWLYIAQTPAHNIVRIPAGRPNGAIELAFQLPEEWLPDGMWFASDGTLIVGCYRPDQVIGCNVNGTCEIIVRDPTAELIVAPTNIFLHDKELYIANLGAYHLTAITTSKRQGPVYRPNLLSTGQSAI